MSKEKQPPATDQKNAASRKRAESDVLTEAQREFARMLGPILARRWQNRHAAKDSHTQQEKK
jgi:hypothetical protein